MCCFLEIYNLFSLSVFSLSVLLIINNPKLLHWSSEWKLVIRKWVKQEALWNKQNYILQSLENALNVSRLHLCSASSGGHFMFLYITAINNNLRTGVSGDRAERRRAPSQQKNNLNQPCGPSERGDNIQFNSDYLRIFCLLWDQGAVDQGTQNHPHGSGTWLTSVSKFCQMICFHTAAVLRERFFKKPNNNESAGNLKAQQMCMISRSLWKAERVGDEHWSLKLHFCCAIIHDTADWYVLAGGPRGQRPSVRAEDHDWVSVPTAEPAIMKRGSWLLSNALCARGSSLQQTIALVTGRAWTDALWDNEIINFIPLLHRV